MKKHIILTATLLISMLGFFHSCKKEYSCQGCNTSNKPPIAIAGSDQFITLPIDSVFLNGSSSNDQDGKIVRLHWSKIEGPASFSINNVDSAKTVVKLLVLGNYQFELTVTDDKGANAKDTVHIKVDAANITNHPPVSCAGQDQLIILPANSVFLNGSCSTDPNNNITDYLWTKISGPSSVSFSNGNEVQTQVKNLEEGIYLFQLKVTDAGGLFSLDTVQVSVISVKGQSNKTVDIYVAGSENGQAKYWKNGQEVLLNSQSYESDATSITVVGNDVYVAGSEGDFFMYGKNKAKYWKNGQEVLLTGPTGAGATSIAVSGNDVYVAGWEYYGNKTVAKYWKNGQPVSLTNGLQDAEATCIIVVGNDVYVSGQENGVAKYWKNGQAVSLTNGSHQAYANSIVIVGNDIYVAGSEGNGSKSVAKYWKNGRPFSLTNGLDWASATSIAVDGNNVYVAGWEGDYYGMVGGSGSVAKYWKNEQVVLLTNGSTYAYTGSIAVFENDIYVAGFEIVGGQYEAKYWKNGQVVLLPGKSGAWATSIVVVPR
ncbi:MAG: hypothetical protein JST17_04560 [Bacteroidetes bacterium]|nr:hypothetical protein [Bacteroidota bacterium]MBS1929681.1 hypothetical protein [Bacteroidota bacterium]